MRFFDWMACREAYGGTVFQWKARFEQMDAFPEIVVAQPTSPADGNIPHVSEYLPLGERDSDLTAPADLSSLPWDD